MNVAELWRRWGQGAPLELLEQFEPGGDSGGNRLIGPDAPVLHFVLRDPSSGKVFELKLEELDDFLE